MPTPIMGPEQRLSYTVDRKLDALRAEEQLAGLQRITLYNGFLEQEVAPRLGDRHEPFTPPKSVETHWFDPCTGHLVSYNPRGTTRFTRDYSQATVLREALSTTDRELTIEVVHRHDDEAEPPRWFPKNARRLNRELFRTLEARRPGALAQQESLDVIMGPHDALHVTEEELVVDSIDGGAYNDYLPYRLLDLSGRVVVNFDYIFADQARHVLDNLLETVNAYHRDMAVNIYHYGKVGLLRGDLHVEQNIVLAPNGAFDETQLREGTGHWPIRNQFSRNGEAAERFAAAVAAEVHHGLTYHTNSILHQTREELTAAKHHGDNGGTSIDMEALLITVPYFGFRAWLPRIRTINHFLAYVPSDEPLLGKTLADTSFPTERQERIGAAVKAEIRSQQ